MLFIAQAGCPEVGPGAWAWWGGRPKKAAGGMAGPQGRGGRLRARAGGVRLWQYGAESSTIVGAHEGSSRGQSPVLPEGTLRSSWSWGLWSASWVPRTQLPLPPQHHTPSQVYSPAHRFWTFRGHLAQLLPSPLSPDVGDVAPLGSVRLSFTGGQRPPYSELMCAGHC